MAEVGFDLLKWDLRLSFAAALTQYVHERQQLSLHILKLAEQCLLSVCFWSVSLDPLKINFDCHLKEH